MKIIKIIANVVGGALALYLGIFLLWVMLGMGCLQYVDQHGWSDNECGQDVMSQVVRTTHAPLIALMFGSNDK
jgi:hypothetical protein